MRILLSFVGHRDPFSLGLLGEEEQAGPILSLLNSQSFERVFLFPTLGAAQNASLTEAAIRQRHAGIGVESRGQFLLNPTDHLAVFNYLFKELTEIVRASPRDELFASISSGTPQMHVCWVLLSLLRIFPLCLLQVRAPQFMSLEAPLVAELNLDSFINGFQKANELAKPIEGVPQKEAGADAFLRVPTGKDSPKPGEVLQLNYSEKELQEALFDLGLAGKHPAILQAVEMAALLADSNCPILIQGETGTGKELFAKLIHRLSPRKAKPFVPVNCAAIPAELVESVLFGHKKGSFTTALNDHPGKFLQAHRGTLFLDELGELPLAAQSKLLRVLEDGVVEAIGATAPIKTEVRVVAATNRDLKSAVASGQFREDLYYRLAVGVIHVPPLRERCGDIPVIALRLLERINAAVRFERRLTPAALKRLQIHNWPGNIRELANVLERSARLCRTPLLDADDLLISEPVPQADPLSQLPAPGQGFSLDGFLSSARKQIIFRALELAGGRQSEAARLLAVSPQAVSRFVQENRKHVNGG